MSEDELKDLLAHIADEKQEWNEPVAPPLAADALARLSEVCRRDLHIELPDDYRALLGIVDGIDYNGSMIYGSQDVASAENAGSPNGSPNGSPYGFLESNRRFRESALARHHVLFGESGDDYYALDTRDNRYGIFDKVSLTPFDRFETCGDLLRFVLRQAMD